MGAANLEMVAILKKWHPFQCEMLNLVPLTRKILEKCYYTKVCDEGKVIPPFNMSSGSHFLKIGGQVKNWQPFKMSN